MRMKAIARINPQARTERVLPRLFLTGCVVK